MHLVACRLALAVVLLLAPPGIVIAGAQASVEYVPLEVQCTSRCTTG